ncbi:unnamed protein product [Caenorhabditis brenneri]
MFSFLANIALRVTKLVFFFGKSTEFNQESLSSNSTMDFIDDMFMAFAVVLEVLATLSVIVYIPMFHSVRKMAHLPSMKQSQPEKYIMFQVMLISVSKTIMGIVVVLGVSSLPVGHFPLNSKELLNFFQTGVHTLEAEQCTTYEASGIKSHPTVLNIH